MNNNTNENTQQTNENVVKPVSGGDVPATAEDIIKQAEQEAAKAAEAYEKKAAPVAPQQDRVQLVDTKPKLHAVQLGGVTMNTETGEKKEIDTTEVLEVAEEKKEETPVTDNNVGGPSKARTFGLILLFVGLLGMIIFLPDISAYIETQKYLRNQPVEEKITTGTLECTMDDSSDSLDYSYKFDFSFTDNKLTSLKNVSQIRGDVSLDEAELDKLKSECDLLVTMVSDLSGISVSCKLENGLFTKTQTFKFASIVVDDAINAYIEAGGSYPYYKDGADIDDIESELLSGNYNCKRVK